MILLAAVRNCIAAGVSRAPDPMQPAMALWVALHGYVALRDGAPGFPWPDGDALLDRLTGRLAELEG